MFVSRTAVLILKFEKALNSPAFFLVCVGVARRIGAKAICLRQNERRGTRCDSGLLTRALDNHYYVIG